MEWAEGGEHLAQVVYVFFVESSGEYGGCEVNYCKLVQVGWKGLKLFVWFIFGWLLVESGGVRLDFEKLLRYKTVLLLLCILIVNAVVMRLLQSLDHFVHVDLYGYGLVFSYEWANPYWYSNIMLWTCLTGATALAAASTIPHYLHSRQPSPFSKLTGFLLPLFALGFQGLAIFFLSQINSIVWSGLYNHGVQYNIDWATTYNPVSMPALTLMAIAFLALIIPAVRALGVIEIEIVDEDK